MRAGVASDATGSPCGRPDGASRTRTGDLLGAIQALSQLSYSPEARRLAPARAQGMVAPDRTPDRNEMGVEAPSGMPFRAAGLDEWRTPSRCGAGAEHSGGD